MRSGLTNYPSTMYIHDDQDRQYKDPTFMLKRTVDQTMWTNPSDFNTNIHTKLTNIKENLDTIIKIPPMAKHEKQGKIWGN